MKGARDCWETLPWETVKAPLPQDLKTLLKNILSNEMLLKLILV